MSRKRNCSEINEATDGSKRLRKQLSQIDLSSDLSSMETDDDEIEEIDEIFNCSTSTSVSDLAQDYNQGASTSQAAFAVPSAKEPKSEPNVTIISQHVLGTSVEPETVEIPDDNASEIVSIDDNASEVVSIDDNVNDVQIADSSVQKTVPKERSVQQNSSARQGSTNRILISDSSDDEQAQDNNTNNRRHSDGFSTAYAYTNTNGDRFDSGSSFRFARRGHGSSFRFARRGHGHAREYHHSHSFQEQLRRQHSENMDRFHEQTRLARDHAARAVRASTSMIPDLVSQFQYHFRRPMFRVADINQHIFGTYSGGR